MSKSVKNVSIYTKVKTGITSILSSRLILENFSKNSIYEPKYLVLSSFMSPIITRMGKLADFITLFKL
ncbi:MAG TPA: hypothetical protein VLB82_05195 [Thermodesulfobacteriota bacterium]|nr:hypothetical protein [Thermodesulfobacteriota bacterium]